jgi:hypothetical protein
MPTLMIRFDTVIRNGWDYFYDLSISNTSIGYCDRHLYVGEYLWIDKFQINEQYRSENCLNPSHYGRKFMKLYYVYARNQGCKYIDCDPNDDAKGFWHKIGFRNIGERTRRGTYPTNTTFRIFRKRI